MGAFRRRSERKSLRETLDAIHYDRRLNGRKPLRRTHHGKEGESVRSKCGPNGEMREHPSILGIRWLQLFAEALRMQGVCHDWRVSAENWEKDGCLELQLQRIVLAEGGEMATALVKGIPLRGVMERGQALGNGPWERWRLPVEMVNNHDTRAALRAILSQQGAQLILEANHVLRAIHGL